MLSNRMTVSLMSLITILALAFVVSPAMAQNEFKVTITGRTSVTHAVDSDGDAEDTTIGLKIETARPVDIMIDDGDLTVNTFGKDGLEITTGAATIAMDDSMNKTATMSYYNVTVPADLATDANLPLRIVVTVSALTTIDPTVTTEKKANMSKVTYHVITVSEYVDTSALPKVVSIQRLRPGSQTVVAAFQEARIEPEPFDVRIVLTEGHTMDPVIAENLVEVENGTASGLVIGATFKRIGPHAEPKDSPTNEDIARTIMPHPIEGMYWHSDEADHGLAGVPRPTYANEDAAAAANDLVPLPTSDDDMYSQYRVTITPHQKSADFNIKIRVKEFHDNGSPVRNTYIAPGFGDSSHLPNGRDILTIPVKGAARNLTAGYKVVIPKDWIIPANGYLVIAQNFTGSEVVRGPTVTDQDWRTNDTPRATHRTPAQLLYNVIQRSELPNLATEFLNGVVVDVESQHPGLVISEVMWGEDVSLATSSHSQYIELYNPGGQYKTVDDADHTPDVNEALTLIFYAPNEFDDIPAVDGDGNLPAGITDRIGTLDTKGAYWSPAAKGQSGRSGTTTGEEREGRGEVVDPVPIVSMYRTMDANGTIDATMGQMASSWMSSQGPKSANFDPLAIGVRHGTPGAATDATVTPADTAAEAKAKADAAAAAQKKIDTTGTIPQNGDIYISEIMFAGGGTLPQWIEIANGSKSEEVNLSGWTLTIANAAADADVSIGASAKFTIPDGTKIGMSGQQKSPSTILVVTEAGRNNVDGSGQVVNLMTDNEVELILAGVTTRKYTMLSADAFSITLAPPEPAATKAPAGETADAKAKREAAEKKAKAERMAASDTVGNLGADGAAAWALPMSEDGRSSIIRRHVQVAVGPAEPEDGTMMENWVLASDTAFAQPTHIRAASYYGAMNDVGTPGFRAGGALPVELSHFRPARDKATGAVVITWSTQSELNNAGFFIKRSQQKDGEFKVINATMIPGAGTTSEKQFYTYTDTTAHPNVVYYYQIEDVSLDGNRQTLTRGIRLKGHIGAAGKATLTWGELKSSRE